ARRAPRPRSRRCPESFDERPAVEHIARARIAQHEVVAGDMREAAEVDGIGELFAAGREAPVATGTRNERVARNDPVAHRRGKAEDVDAADPRVHHDAVAQAEALALAPRGATEGEPAFRERAEPAHREAKTVAHVDDARLGAMGRQLEIDPAARVSELGIAERLVEPPRRPVERVLA